MAFHVACPITCRRICDCELGFPAGLRGLERRRGFLDEIGRLEEFLRDPWCLRVGETVQVLVPKVEPLPAAPPSAAAAQAADDGEDAAVAASAQAKRNAMQQQAVAASLAAEDYVRRLEAGGAAVVEGEAVGEEQGSPTAKVMCRICFSGEREGSDKAVKMLSCKICNKKYHKSCLKTWAEYRDLFHWSSWACPSCRTCEVCRRAGDPTKLVYCKRCDGAYHCYCQQPPHKNVSHGPYLCPKHTRCHSCGSNVPGSGLSTRWFLGYTCCDACGRLFVKGNYCPVCLKVYRDSETTPMVCCDVCERWVHCVCDGISDEKYQQFQADQNLYYKCAACRGYCYQVRDIDDAVRELWKRRDEADVDLIRSLKEAAGLPSQEEILSIAPYSDDEQTGPVVLKNDSGRPLKFSVKGLSDNSTKNSKESKLLLSNKKHVKKKGYQIKFVHKSEESYQNFDRHHEARSPESNFREQKIGDIESYKAHGPEVFSSSMTKSPYKGEVKSCAIQMGSNNHSFIEDAVVNNVDRMSKIQKENKLQGLHVKEAAGKIESKREAAKGTKLVIHFGTKNRNTSNSPRSETSSCHREQDIAAPCGPGSGTVAEATLRSDGLLPEKQPMATPGNVQSENHDTSQSKFIPDTSSDLRPLLKLKFKNPYFEQRGSWAPKGDEENSVKRQRSKRKRPSTEQAGSRELHQETPIDEAMDAKILQKLGKDAVGKRVEVHQSPDNSWHHGVVLSADGTSLIVRLDDGKITTLELGKQGVRFAAQKKQKRRNT